MSKETKDEVLKVRTDSFTKKRVEKLAKKKGITSAQILRRAITEYVERQEEVLA
jgi:predicted transcriptional regulator